MSKLITEIELAAWFEQSVTTVRRNRTAAPERHPPFIKIGSSVRYDPAVVQEWLDSRIMNGLDATIRPQTSASVSRDTEKAHRHPGRPNKAESFRKTKNAAK